MRRAEQLGRRRGRGGAGMLAALLLLSLATSASAGSLAATSSGSMPEAGAIPVRILDDPATGDRWLLVRDPGCPGCPGRMARLAGRGGRPFAVPQLQSAVPSRPVIRGGDGIQIEESTPLLDASLEAVALEPAPVGGHFRARLRATGGLVVAIALAPGRASLVGPSGGAR